MSLTKIGMATYPIGSFQVSLIFLSLVSKREVGAPLGAYSNTAPATVIELTLNSTPLYQ